MRFIKEKIDNCVAIGEMGLDYWINTEKKVQRQVLKDLLKLASKNNKAISVHSRGAWEETYTMVKRAGIKKAVFHWYSGPINILKKF